MKEWNDLINNLSQTYSQLYHQGITHTSLNTLQTLTNYTRSMTNGLRGRISEQIINQIEAYAEYLGWISRQLPQDANLISYLYWTLNQLISLLTRVVYTTKYAYKRKDHYFPFIFFFWRPWGGWWCGPGIFYLLPLATYRLGKLLRGGIQEGALDSKAVPYLKYLASQTQFILKSIPEEIKSLLNKDLTSQIYTQSQEIVSTVEKVTKDLKIPEKIKLQNLGNLIEQINGSIEQMTQQISPWLINSFSEIANSVQKLITEVKKTGSILPEVAYQLKSIVAEGESTYVGISELLHEKIGKQFLDNIHENLVKVANVTDSIYTQIEGKLARIPVQRLEELTPALTQLGSASGEVLSKMKIDPKILSKFSTAFQKGKLPSIASWVLPGASSVQIGSTFLKTPEAAVLARATGESLGKLSKGVSKGIGSIDASKLAGAHKLSRAVNFGSGLKQAAQILAKILKGFRF
ncbi:MAG: hypothetical protein ACFFCD_11195 [Promethearchaeota archaeon]